MMSCVGDRRGLVMSMSLSPKTAVQDVKRQALGKKFLPLRACTWLGSRVLTPFGKHNTAEIGLLRSNCTAPRSIIQTVLTCDFWRQIYKSFPFLNKQNSEGFSESSIEDGYNHSG
jgi:hypothetical protein